MKNIDEILKKYYSGETSREEEQQLKDYFLLNKNSDSTRFAVEKQIFSFYNSEKNIELQNDFDEKILNKVLVQKVSKLNFLKNNIYYKIAGIAAVLSISIGLYFIINNSFLESNTYTQRITLTDDEKFALETTISALTLVSDYLNLANEKISIISTSFEAIEKVSYIETYNIYILNILGEAT